MSTEEQLTTAAQYTEQLLPLVPAVGTDLDTLWAASSGALAKLSEAGYSPEEFLPDDEAAQLNFTVPGADRAQLFFRCYALEVRKSFCGADGELRKSVQTAMTTGTTTLLTTMAAALAVPLGAIIVLAPIAAVMLSKGIDALCSMDISTTSSSDKLDKPSESGRLEG